MIDRTSEANSSDQLPSGSGFWHTYSGLIPWGSRASESCRWCGSQSAKANMPRRRAHAAGAAAARAGGA